MNRLFRQPSPGLSGYAALTLFAATYIWAIAVVLVPDTFRASQPNPVTQGASFGP